MQNHAGLPRQGRFGPDWLLLATVRTELTSKEALHKAQRGKKGSVCMRQRSVREMVSEQTEQFVHGKLHCFSLYQDPKQRRWPLP